MKTAPPFLPNPNRSGARSVSACVLLVGALNRHRRPSPKTISSARVYRTSIYSLVTRSPRQSTVATSRVVRPPSPIGYGISRFFEDSASNGIGSAVINPGGRHTGVLQLRVTSPTVKLLSVGAVRSRGPVTSPPPPFPSSHPFGRWGDECLLDLSRDGFRQHNWSTTTSFHWNSTSFNRLNTCLHDEIIQNNLHVRGKSRCRLCHWLNVSALVVECIYNVSYIRNL